jgi:hypothetical protein
MKNIKRLLQILGVGCLLSHSVVLYIMFLKAWFNDYRTLINVNVIGEAGVEFVVIPFTIMLGVYGLYGLVRNLGKVSTKKGEIKK